MFRRRGNKFFVSSALLDGHGEHDMNKPIAAADFHSVAGDDLPEVGCGMIIRGERGCWITSNAEHIERSHT
jgi:hypothetical protein